MDVREGRAVVPTLRAKRRGPWPGPTLPQGQLTPKGLHARLGEQLVVVRAVVLPVMEPEGHDEVPREGGGGRKIPVGGDSRP